MALHTLFFGGWWVEYEGIISINESEPAGVVVFTS